MYLANTQVFSANDEFLNIVKLAFTYKVAKRRGIVPDGMVQSRLSSFVERHKLVFLNTMVYCMRDNILSPYNTCRQHQRPCVDQPDSHMCYIRLYDYKYTAFVTRYISIQHIVIFLADART